MPQKDTEELKTATITVWNTASWNLEQQSQKIYNNVLKNYDET
jgi:hypothetical protein